MRCAKMIFGDYASLSCFLMLAFMNYFCEADDCNGCCTTYRNISDPRRSTESVWERGQRPLCDRGLQWGWYRFISFAGDKMPETKVPPNRCGTHSPIWLRGTHPTATDGNVVRKACINAFGLNNGCWRTFDINITSCGTYFVYYLRPPFYCSVAFCAGKRDV